MKMKLLDTKIPLQGFIDRQQKLNQPVAVPGSEGGCYIRVFCHRIGQAHGHIFLGGTIVQKILILISQALCFVDVDEAVLEAIGNGRQGGGAYDSKEKERNYELPFEANILKSQ